MHRLMSFEEMQHRLSVQVVPIFAFSGTKSMVIGTAVMVALGIALTAQHVMVEIGEQFNLPLQGNQNIDIYLFQISTGATWYVCNSSYWIGADIAVLSLRPRNDEAKAVRISRLQLTVDPPLVGQVVTAIGYPRSEMVIPKNDAEYLDVEMHLNPTVSEGPVTDVHASLRDSYSVRFPSFSVEANYSGGMSGGPVFNDRAQICGLVCTGGEGELANYAVATSIWTAAIVPARMPEWLEPYEGVSPGQSYKLLELARVGYIDLVGHERIEFFTHENGSLGVRRRHW